MLRNIIVCMFLCALYVDAGPTTIRTAIRPTKSHLLGSKECTWGPTYWCSNITNAKSCNAVQHCIQTVWEKQALPSDDDSVCQICVKMVTEARDQLESNETQEELKEVFEGSCKLIPLKTISKECCKLADEFIPQLIEMLASQMNPQVVCSVAGLCNSARIDKMLAQLESETKRVPISVGMSNGVIVPMMNKPSTVKVKDDQCEGCHTVVAKLQKKFAGLTRDEVLQGILRVCGRLSSFSDSCTNIVITYFNEIYAHLQENLNPDEVCLMAGVCTAQFHTHVQVTPLSEMGKVDIATKDDLPCELCEQLVKHLRDLLVANTTEDEFQLVLEGLCKQTKGFQDECLSLVDQYYPEVYHFLVTELDANAVCVLMGICKGSEEYAYAPTSALLLPETVKKYKEILSSKPSKPEEEVKIIQEGANVKVNRPDLVQLPIERMMPVSLTLAGNTQLCTFCEYFLHFVQQEITTPANEEKIKEVVDEACAKLPKAVSNECVQFVDTYGEAFIALLAQEIDPSQVCPLLSLCPATGLQDVEVLMHNKPKDKPNCPLCLLAVTQLEDMVKDHKTVEAIQAALKKLCSHLSNNLAPQCNDFVDTYAEELVEMLVADLTPQEVCVYLKLCDDKSLRHTPALIHKPQSVADHMTLTNEIPDNTIEGRVPEEKKSISSPKLENRSPQCVICEFVMSKIEEELENQKNEDEIKRIVHGVCNHLPKTVATDCNNFVNKYADMIIQLLIQTMEPSEICSMLSLCQSNAKQIREEILDCAVCETTVTALEKLMTNPKIDHTMEHVLKKACLALPGRYNEKCKAMIDAYGDSFFALVSKYDSNAVCTKVGLCSQAVSRPTRQALIGENRCTWGPSYWCKDEKTASECNALQHCQEKVWKASTAN